jgi:F-type H+-transporting ATPase subunit b
MLHSLTTFGASSSGLGALGINGQAFLIQLVTFVIIFLVLKKYAFKPILKVLNNRRELIEDGVRIGEEMKQKRNELEQEISSKLSEARATADKMIIEVQKEARQIIISAEEAAKQKTEKILASADDQIKQDSLRARRGLEKELVGLISEATEVIIGEKVDAKKDAVLIERALKAK